MLQYQELAKVFIVIGFSASRYRNCKINFRPNLTGQLNSLSYDLPIGILV